MEMQENLKENGRLKTFFRKPRVQQILFGILIYFLIALLELLLAFFRIDFKINILIDMIKNGNFSCLKEYF